LRRNPNRRLLGRGKLSLPSQLKVDNFYGFSNISEYMPSPVLLGLPANLYGGGTNRAEYPAQHDLSSLLLP
jgi:hypothetical protein